MLRKNEPSAHRKQHHFRIETKIAECSMWKKRHHKPNQECDLTNKKLQKQKAANR